MVQTATATIERRERREGETVVAFEKVQLAFDEKVVLKDISFVVQQYTLQPNSLIQSEAATAAQTFP